MCFMLSVFCPQMMDESEACSLPGGLASVKRQFENQEFASSSSQSTVTQFHFEQRSVQVRMWSCAEGTRGIKNIIAKMYE